MSKIQLSDLNSLTELNFDRQEVVNGGGVNSKWGHSVPPCDKSRGGYYLVKGGKYTCHYPNPK
jgi:hypothetical protein